jgi:NADH-quinone oxidoreductase subunit M
MVAGLASLGLPGLSGFAAEVTIFFGAWQHSDVFYRTLTVIAVSSVVITAVYVLRVVGRLLMGSLQVHAAGAVQAPATWYEKTAAAMLVLGIILIGVLPAWLATLIRDNLYLYVK